MDERDGTAKQVSRNNYDFSGWATKNNIRCSDGRTIKRNAFADQDGQIVPIVYQHNHNDINQVLGHALLENRDDGVYMYGLFSDSTNGKAAKEAVKHGDIKGLSIWANKLKEKAGDVLHGMIQEVSLVLRGANPGALIDKVLAHSDEEPEFELVYQPVFGRILNMNGEEVLVHSDSGEELGDNAIFQCISSAGVSLIHSDNETDDDDDDDDTDAELEHSADDVRESIKAALALGTPEEQQIVYAVINHAGKKIEDMEGTGDPEAAKKAKALFDSFMKKLDEKQQNLIYSVIGGMSSVNAQENGELAQSCEGDKCNSKKSDDDPDDINDEADEDDAEDPEKVDDDLKDLDKLKGPHIEASCKPKKKKSGGCCHSDDSDIVETMVSKLTEEEITAYDVVLAHYNDPTIQHDDLDRSTEIFLKSLEKFDAEELDTIQPIVDYVNENQNNTEIQHSEGETNMKHVFDQTQEQNENVLTHSDELAFINNALAYAKEQNANSWKGILARGLRDKSLLAMNSLSSEKTEMLAHSFDDAVNKAHEDGTLAHGIDGIDLLFPDYKELNPTPKTNRDPDDWVDAVMGAIKKVPYTRFKTTFANVDYDTARANGYITGDFKRESWFNIANRQVNPQTVYIKQELDKDNIDDITGFDVVAWMKGEMVRLLRNECARAYLIGDGKDFSDRHKINENNIIPIWKDVAPYVINKVAAVDNTLSDEAIAKKFIKDIKLAMDDYRGTGKPTLYCPTSTVTKCLLIEDTTGRPIYLSKQQLVDAMGVKAIVEVFPMKNCQREVNGVTRTLQGILVNLQDYSVGTQKGGEIESFNFFDIDFNTYKYLDETRQSAMLTEYNSAIVFETVYGLVCTVTATSGSTTRYGKTVSDLQKDAFIHDNWVDATLKYVASYDGYEAGAKGYFLAIDIAATEGATITHTNFAGRSVTVTDGYIVMKVTPQDVNKRGTFTVSVAKTGEATLVKTFKLGSIRFEGEEA